MYPPSRLPEEGWYLMSTSELERELARWRGGDPSPSEAIRLSNQEALDLRNAGNIPDERGRTLRLVLHVDSPETGLLEKKRLLFEPDYHDAPEWRREGSVPVNLVPLRTAGVAADASRWWDDPALGALEREWAEQGTVEGVTVPGAYRGFVFKTVLALRAAGRPISAGTVADSIARWVPAPEADEIRKALAAANPVPSDENGPGSFCPTKRA
jgi:hypothetical protein